MIYYLTKLSISAIIIVVISEIAKRSTVFAALIAALPTTTVLAIIWMWFDKVPSEKIAALSGQVFWFVFPSLIFFILFPFLLRLGHAFWISLLLASGSTSFGYLLFILILRQVSPVTAK